MGVAAALPRTDRFYLVPRLAADAIDIAAWSASDHTAVDTSPFLGFPLAMEAGTRMGVAGLVVPDAIGVVSRVMLSRIGRRASPWGSTAGSSQPAYAAMLQSEIAKVMTANAIPGVVVLIKSPSHGDWSARFGTAELGKTVPMSLDDYFRIGSNTKTMTSTVILQLVQEGKLKLDDPIGKYRSDVPNGQNITIDQLSEMRSGLYSYTFDKGFNETLLGVVIEQLTGMSASDAFQKRIFDPLKLTHSSLPKNTDSSIPNSHPQGYQFGTNAATIDSYAVPAANLSAALDGTLKPINETDSSPSWAWTAGGAISTPDDLAVYVKALVGGGLLDAKTQQIRLDSVIPSDPSRPDGIGYGLGIARFAPNIYGHDGQLPGFSTFMVYDSEQDTTIIIGANLSASPVDGQNASVVLGKTVISIRYNIPGLRGVLSQRSRRRVIGGTLRGTSRCTRRSGGGIGHMKFRREGRRQR
jgi:D-alanyl-D-alanine carboxypeptidase